MQLWLECNSFPRVAQRPAGSPFSGTMLLLVAAAPSVMLMSSYACRWGTHAHLHPLKSGPLLLHLHYCMHPGRSQPLLTEWPSLHDMHPAARADERDPHA